jgi:hypothetical protein
MKQSNKVKIIRQFPAGDSMPQLLRHDAAVFIANPGLVEFRREVTGAERERGCNHSHVLVTLYCDGITHQYGDLIPWTQILAAKLGR